MKKLLTVTLLGLGLSLSTMVLAKSVEDKASNKVETPNIPLSETFLSASDVELILQSITATQANYSCPSNYSVEFKVEKAITSVDHLFLGHDGKVKQAVKKTGEFTACTDKQLTVLSYCVEPTCVLRESVPALVVKK